MYSQRDEEQVILDYFQPRQGTGRFLDVGAYDGLTFSNTRRLAELGWSGVMLEPSPPVLAGLERNMADFPQVVILQAALAFDAGVRNMSCTPDAVSTFDENHVRQWRGHNVRFETYPVACITWNQLLDQHGTDFDLVDLDTEGDSVALLEAMPIARLPRLQMVVVEFDAHAARVRDWAKRNGFKQHHRTPENLILKR